MQTYAQVLNIAIPFFLVLIFIEYLWSRWVSKDTYHAYDTISSLSSGVSNIIKDVMGLTIIIVSYSFLHEHLAVLKLESTLLMTIICFIGLDFAGYWQHRLEHRINILWNRHIIHHSSEEFNLACALRQTISTVFALFTILLVPIAILGVPPETIAIIAPLHLFLQFWYHTRLIHRMGWLEKIIVTPSHHRVHHAINDQYIDKNFGQIFILWDKWFGTFQEELANVTPQYGVKSPVKTWNPFLINFKHFYQMLRDAYFTKNWKDKFLLWVKPTGYRPEDRVLAEPLLYIDTNQDYNKYRTPISRFLVVWSWLQLFIVLGLALHLFSLLDAFPLLKLIPYVLILFAILFSYTSLLDRHRWSLYSIFFQIGLFLSIYLKWGSWYGLEETIPFFHYLFVSYLVVNIGITLYFLTPSKSQQGHQA